MVNIVTVVTTVLVTILTLILQKAFSRFLSGISLKIARPFKKGEKITVRHISNDVASGIVLKLGFLYTKIKAYNRDVYILNNGFLDDCIIINSDYTDGVNHTEYIKVTTDSDLEKVNCVISATLCKHPNTNNTCDNTDIIFRYDSGGVLIQYNVRTNDTETSYNVSSDIAKHLIKTFNSMEDVKLI